MEELNEVDGVGGVIAAGIHDFFHREEKLEQLERLMRELRLAEETVEEGHFYTPLPILLIFQRDKPPANI